MKILSVDDDPVFLEIIKSELLEQGYDDVVQASSGHEALDLVASTEQDFDCFLLDIDMPGMDGVTLCQQLRALPQAQDATIIMVTSRAEMESVDRAFSMGATDYLNKPLNALELRGRLRSTETYVRERAKKKVGGFDSTSEPQFEITDAIRLDPTAGGIEYIAMQNFVLKLGSMQMFNKIALGVHVQNIEDMYFTMSASDFRNTLSDVAEVIVDAVGAGPKVLSYAGSGDFILLLTRSRYFDQERLAEELSLALQPLGEWYSSEGFLTPVLQLGKPISKPLLSLSAPDDVLDHAIESARESHLEIRHVASHMMPKTKKSQKVSFWR